MCDSLEVGLRSHAAFLDALGNEKRLLILLRLLEEEQPVGVLARKVGLSQSALSQHLSKLRKQGLVSSRKQSKIVFYSTDNVGVKKIVDVLRSLSMSPLPAHLTRANVGGMDATVQALMIAQMKEYQ